tara:strand:- start:1020 stop:1127 length:108 start_codon:yes stop_codon:yes gene_type:complete
MFADEKEENSEGQTFMVIFIMQEIVTCKHSNLELQ